MQYGNGQGGMPIDPVGIGRILAQRIQARSGGPGQALGINQRSGGGMSMPAAPLPQTPPLDQGGSDLGPTMGLLGLMGAMGKQGTQTLPQIQPADVGQGMAGGFNVANTGFGALDPNILRYMFSGYGGV